MSMLLPLQERFTSLQPREKVVVTTGALLVLLTVLWALFNPVLNQRSRLIGERISLNADMNYLQDQTEVMARLQNNCPQQQIVPQQPAEFIRRQAERNQLALTGISSIRSDLSRVSLTGTEGNGILRFAHQIVCQGFSLQKLEVMRNAETGEYTAAVEVHYGR